MLLSLPFVFTGSGMISQWTREKFDVDQSDKFKNCELSADPKHANTHPITHFKPNKGKYPLALCDMPYSTQQAGHNLLNCDAEKSMSFLDFNDSYGTLYPYTKNNILELHSIGLCHGSFFLAPGGFLLLKLKDYDGVCYQNETIRLALESNQFVHKGTYIYFPSGTKKVMATPRDYSMMLVFQKKKEGNGKEGFKSGMSFEQIFGESREDYQADALAAHLKQQKENQELAAFLCHFMAMYDSFDEATQALKSMMHYDDEQLTSCVKRFKLQERYHERYQRNSAYAKGIDYVVEEEPAKKKGTIDSYFTSS